MKQGAGALLMIYGAKQLAQTLTRRKNLAFSICGIVKMPLIEAVDVVTFVEILAKLRSEPSVDVPTAGWALGRLAPNTSYMAAKRGDLGVPVYSAGGKLRVASVHVLQKLGLADQHPQAEPGAVVRAAPFSSSSEDQHLTAGSSVRRSRSRRKSTAAAA